MSITYDRIKIGETENGETKFIDNLNVNTLSYDLVADGGEEFTAEVGTAAISRLRSAFPEKDFSVLPA